MRRVTLPGLLAVCSCAAAISFPAVGARAATPLPWSNAFTAIRECSGSVCTDLEIVRDYGYDKDAAAFANLPGAGVAYGSSMAGTDALALPVMKAYTSAELGYSSTTFVNPVQGYKWTGEIGVDIAFSGVIDYLGSGPGFVTAGLAITDTSVRDPAIGAPWVMATGDGTFGTSCSTPGALALVNSGRQSVLGANSFGIDTSEGVCPARGATFHVNPGDEFFVFARLLTFSYHGGEWDASHTFTVGLSPTLSEETRTLINQYLVPFQSLAAVPEPSTWLMMIIGFGGTGSMIRRRRIAMAAPISPYCLG